MVIAFCQLLNKRFTYLLTYLLSTNSESIFSLRGKGYLNAAFTKAAEFAIVSLGSNIHTHTFDVPDIMSLMKKRTLNPERLIAQMMYRDNMNKKRENHVYFIHANTHTKQHTHTNRP